MKSQYCGVCYKNYAKIRRERNNLKKPKKEKKEKLKKSLLHFNQILEGDNYLPTKNITRDEIAKATKSFLKKGKKIKRSEKLDIALNYIRWDYDPFDGLSDFDFILDRKLI